ncbi:MULTISPECIES: class I SAM-dependent methyltransferase [unclassified Granulicatella]|uniref:class I SAM-dependent methyltransferase n=1 Tax=unclassified Granulicatella TaxID=2630493 RepID=UPI0010735CE5|nr:MULTISPECIES: methyltransferase [unclassified Granulicatella]MBF0780175.1 class I SAM-dependent methyltransferase [Granulicatella sp. 19428wC4_WM01]TFU95726.1 class I SAM-dependent methyltransferase [Granulicatella sp. WM01]
MTNHYYTNQSEVISQERKHTIHVANLALQMYTDNGVFSKMGLDFGSRVLIETLLQEKLCAGNILDVGCGYGPIGITLAKYYPDKFIQMVDINERAVHLANKNIELNTVTNAHALHSNLYEHIEDFQLACIVSNPPIRAGKSVVHHIIEHAHEHLASEGKLIIVIQKKQGAPSAQKKMESIFGNVTLLNREKGYWILCSQKDATDRG